MEMKTIIIIVLALIMLVIVLIFGVPMLETSKDQAQAYSQIPTSLLPSI